MHPWIVIVKRLDIRYTVYADTRSKARYKSWRQARDAGYKLAFGDIDVRWGEA